MKAFFSLFVFALSPSTEEVRILSREEKMTSVVRYWARKSLDKRDMYITPSLTKIIVSYSDTSHATYRYSGKLKKHKNEVKEMIYSPSEKSFYSLSDDSVCSWSKESLQCVKSFRRKDDTGDIFQIALSGDGSTLCCAEDNVVHMWDTKKKKKMSSFKAFTTFILLNKDASSLFMATRRGIEVWNLRVKNSMFFLVGREGGAKKLLLSKDERTLLAASSFEISLWDVSTRGSILHYKAAIGAPDSIVLHSDGSMLYYAAQQGIECWNIQESKRVEFLRKHHKPITCLLLSEKNDLLFSAGFDGIGFWDIGKGECFAFWSIQRNTYPLKSSAEYQ